MRDIVLFIEVPDSGSTAPYHRAARSLGLSPVVVSGSPFDQNDVDGLVAASMDVASILSAVDRIGQDRVAGVFAAGSVHAELAARLAAALDRPHADPAAIALCNNKHRLRRFLDEKGLNTVAYHHIWTVAEATSAVESIGGVAVVKPVSSSGSNDVRVCRTPEEAIAHATRLLKRRKDGLLVEAYIDAPQYSVECFDGIPMNVKRLYFSEGPFPNIVGIDSPASLKESHFDEIKKYAESIVREVGIIDGPAFVELRQTDAEKHVIEVNPRPSLNSYIELYAATGIDICDLCMKFVCNIGYDRKLFENRRSNRFCAGRHIIRNGSSVRSIEGIEEARKLPGVTSVQVSDLHFYRFGPGTCSLDRVVAVHSEADSPEEAAVCADLAIEKLSVVYDKFPLNRIKYHARRIRILWTRLLNKFRGKQAQLTRRACTAG